MKRCCLLGAGFSKAVAHLPLMRELTSRFDNIREEQSNLGHKNRVERGVEINRFLEYLENEYFKKPHFDSNQAYHNCDLNENIEAIISYIDLCLSGDISATKIDVTGEKSDFTKKGLFGNYSYGGLGHLDELKTSLKTYIYLALTKPNIDREILEAFIDCLTDKGETITEIVTFNYDLVLEMTLYERGLWFPKDGYGFKFQDLPDIKPSKDGRSEISIYKLHGSLNWEYDEFFDSQVKLKLFYEDYKTPYFPNYLVNEDIYPPVIDSAHFGLWMMPSFFKQFDIPEMLHVWQNAFNALNEADKIVVIGYSLPKEDSAACLLLGTTNISKKN